MEAKKAAQAYKAPRHPGARDHMTNGGSCPNGI